jgi:hypothetical protein
MRFLYVICALLVIVGLSAFHNPKEDTDVPVLEEISQCLSTQDIDQLAELFDQQVEISLSGRSQAYAPAQARQVLKSFVDQHPPMNFTFSEQGTSLHMLYALGTYKTRSQVFEVDIYLKKKTGEEEYKIDQMGIEPKKK